MLTSCTVLIFCNGLGYGRACLPARIHSRYPIRDQEERPESRSSTVVNLAGRISSASKLTRVKMHVASELHLTSCPGSQLGIAPRVIMSSLSQGDQSSEAASTSCAKLTAGAFGMRRHYRNFDPLLRPSRRRFQTPATVLSCADAIEASLETL